MANGAPGAAPDAAPNKYVLRLERLETEVAELKRVIAGLAAVFGGNGGEAASDRELDHPQHGDPEVRLIPRDAVGCGVTKGQKFSRCPADFLEMLAESYDWFATKNDETGAVDGKGKPKSVWDKKSARLARGWARRIREGWTPPPPPPAPNFGGAAPSAFGGGGGFGSPSRAWGSDGTSSNGSRGFLGAGPPAAPTSAPASEPEHDDDSFNFGANAEQTPTTTSTTEPPEDDDPPL